MQLCIIVINIIIMEFLCIIILAQLLLKQIKCIYEIKCVKWDVTGFSKQNKLFSICNCDYYYTIRINPFSSKLFLSAVMLSFVCFMKQLNLQRINAFCHPSCSVDGTGLRITDPVSISISNLAKCRSSK